jgi:hypothetical protein
MCPLHEEYNDAVVGRRLEPVRTCPPGLELQDLNSQSQCTLLSKAKSLEHCVSLPREILIVGCICLSMFTTQVGVGITIDLLHIIGKHFGVRNPSTLSWFIAGCKSHYSVAVRPEVLPDSTWYPPLPFRCREGNLLILSP